MEIEELMDGMKQSMANTGVQSSPDDLFDHVEKVHALIEEIKKDDVDHAIVALIGLVTGFYKIVSLEKNEASADIVSNILTLMAVSAKQIDEKYEIIERIAVEEE